MERSLPPLVEQVLDRFAAQLRQRFGPRLLELRLFGSYARGEADERSDLDVFVLLDLVSWADRKEVLDLAGDLWRDTELFVAPLIVDRAQYETWRRQERPLFQAIALEGLAR
jgi:predicted nucleotidyltransferase